MQYYSQIGQDKTVLDYYKNKTDGYFVDIGAYDGVNISNTYAMEKLGWKGICVEPIPDLFTKLKANRNCILYNVAIDKDSDKILTFVDADYLSGDIERLNTERCKYYNPNNTGLDNTIKVKTLNFTKMLDESNAPNFIEFLSLDTEGSEYDILCGLDFNKYKFGYISVEHNFLEPARSNIRTLLLQNGYVFKKENQFDDDYIYPVTAP